MNLKCLFGKHYKSRLTSIQNNDHVMIKMNDGKEHMVKLPNTEVEVCKRCKTLFYVEQI